MADPAGGDPFHQLRGAGAPVAEVHVPSLAAALKPLGDVLPLAQALEMARAAAAPLEPGDRQAIVAQARAAVDRLYVHLYLKKARHAFDPVAALERLERDCDRLGSDMEFHTWLATILNRMHDIHTGYILPAPWVQMVALLPFTVARCNLDPHAGDPGVDSPRTAIVAGVLNGFEHDTFRPGVRLVAWNGVPIETAIARVGAFRQGANRAAQLAFGSLMLTIRWLGSAAAPDELWVTVAYLDEAGALREIRFPWTVLLLPDSDDPADQAFPPLQALGQLQAHLSALHDVPSVSVERPALTGRSMARLLYHHPGGGPSARQGLQRTPVPTRNAETFTAERLTCAVNGKPFTFGRIHLHHFIYPETEEYLADLKATIAEMPREGLVIDIRGNGGGAIDTAERALQLCTTKDIRPLPFQFRATPEVLRLVRSAAFAEIADELPGWDRRVAPLIEDAAQYSLNGTMTDPALLAAVPVENRYPGPVVLLTDAMTYSAGDMFAASFQDHGVGPVVGVDRHTGGGGANMWFHSSTVSFSEPPTPFAEIPGGAQLHYAVRRCLRIGAENGGLPFEEDGVAPDILRPLTVADMADRARDLLLFSAELLADPTRASRPA